VSQRGTSAGRVPAAASTDRQNARVTDTRVAPAGGPRARVERAALDLFTLRGFENVTSDEVADAAGISRRTFFRYFATKADAVWGDFSGHVARLEGLLAAAGRDRPVLAAICAAYVEVNDYPDAELPVLRERMQLILREPALLAHSQLRYTEVDRVVARHVAERTGAAPGDLVPRLVAASTRAAATTAFEAWLADEHSTLGGHLRRAFEEMAGGFPSLSR
jgi:mycofactocin system transcriptional regulator